MIRLELFFVLLPGLLAGYAYLVYPALLKLWGSARQARPPLGDPPDWPSITIVVPAYNEEAAIGPTLESLLALEYPVDRMQILVVSDCSSDRTDAIVAGYAGRGVELLRLPTRSGKTAAENAALHRLTGAIVVNTDATIRILPTSIKPLIRVFQDPGIGVASGRDMSVGDITAEGNQGESGYVGYEMWVRSLETAVGSIVGASGCFYAIRRELHETLIPSVLSRDFASALTAREHGMRAVSVNDAVCLVPRTVSLGREFRRKVRTMARGLETLWFKRHLLNPFRYGRFAWMLWSHKLVRWLVFLVWPLAVVGLGLLAWHSRLAAAGLALVGLGIGMGVLAWRAPEGKRVAPVMALCGFALVSHVAGLVAWSRALRGERNPIWEPTRRPM